MDIYNSRTASVGLIFILFFFAGVCEIDFCGVRSFFSSYIFNKDYDFSFIAAVVGGIATLPVVGRVFELPSVLIASLLRRRKSSFPMVSVIGTSAATLMSIDPAIPPSGAFHIIYYTKCPTELRDWTHRRRNRMYAATASSLACILGLIAAIVAEHQAPLLSILLALVFVALQLVHFYSELKLHDTLILAWWSTMSTTNSEHYHQPGAEQHGGGAKPYPP